MDRFGEPPKSVQNLLAIANLKAMAHKAYITEISQKGDSIRFTMFERAKADPAKIEHLVEKYKNNNKNQLNFKVDTNPYFEYKKPRKSLKDNDDILQVVRELVEEIALVKSV